MATTRNFLLLNWTMFNNLINLPCGFEFVIWEWWSRIRFSTKSKFFESRVADPDQGSDLGPVLLKVGSGFFLRVGSVSGSTPPESETLFQKVRYNRNINRLHICYRFKSASWSSLTNILTIQFCALENIYFNYLYSGFFHDIYSIASI